MKSHNSNLVLDSPCPAGIPGKDTRPVFSQPGTAYSASAWNKEPVLNSKEVLSYDKAFFAWQSYTHLAAAFLFTVGKELTCSQELSHCPPLALPIASNGFTQPTPVLFRPVCVYSISPTLKKYWEDSSGTDCREDHKKEIIRSRQGYLLPWRLNTQLNLRIGGNLTLHSRVQAPSFTASPCRHCHRSESNTNQSVFILFLPMLLCTVVLHPSCTT